MKTLSSRLSPFGFLFVAALGIQSMACIAEPSLTDDLETADPESKEDELTLATDTKVKNAIVATTTGLLYTSESDHPFVWVRSSTVAKAPADAWFVHKSFSSVTNNDAMADKPLAKLKSETIPFEAFAARFAPVAGEDADNFVYHQRMTKVFVSVRANLKNPVVIRFGRPSGGGLMGALSVYIIGTLPSGKVGGLFTVAVET